MPSQREIRLNAFDMNCVGHQSPGLWAHPQLAARQRWCSVGTPAGPVQALLPPGANSAFDYRMDAVPSVGEHSAAILAELGWSAERIRALYAEEATL